MPRTETYIFWVCVWGETCNRSDVSYVRRLRGEELSGERCLSLEEEAAVGKGRWRTQDHQKIRQCSGAAIPGSPLRPGFARLPWHRAQPLGAAPSPCGAAPSRHRAAEIPRSPARPCPGAPSGAPRARGSPAVPGPLAGRSPTTTITSPLLRGRAVSSPPATSHAPQAESQHPPRAGPAPLGRETMSSHNSPAAPALRGSGGGSFAPSPSPSPPPRSGIRPPGAETPLPSSPESLRRTAGRAPSPRKVTLFPAPTWLLPPPPPP